MGTIPIWTAVKPSNLAGLMLKKFVYGQSVIAQVLPSRTLFFALVCLNAARR